ncbi:MAG: Ig-like domain-containing protein [Candidatus Bathyarchaeia archaeon]
MMFIMVGVLPPPPDTTPPSVRITYPENGDIISGAIIVSVEASDNISVVRVELYRNNALFAVDSETPYQFYWDTTADPDGTYTLVAKAYDSAGSVGVSSPISVSVVNTRDITPPDAYRWNTGSVKDGSHMITAKAYDKYGNTAETSIRVHVESMC